MAGVLASLEEVEILKKSVDWPYALGDVGVSLESHPEFGWFLTLNTGYLTLNTGKFSKSQ